LSLSQCKLAAAGSCGDVETFYGKSSASICGRYFEELGIAINLERSNDWLACTLAAFAADRERELARSVGLWRQSSDFVFSFPDSDPRRAAAFSNAGLACLLSGQYEEAAGFLENAAAHWRLAVSGIEVAEIPLAGAGSAFHLSLASRHGETLTRIRRDTYIGICRGAAAITNAVARRLGSNNRISKLNEADVQDDITALESAFGIDCAEALLLKHTASKGATALRVDELRFLYDRWPGVARQTRSEIRPFVDAAYLTAGLHRRDQ
jgi:hypothetical protein